MEQNEIKYKDMINLPHPVSKKHPHMSMLDRAAQFAPFAALTGFEDEIQETGRLTTRKKEVNEELKQILDNKLQIIRENILSKPEIKCTYFMPDLLKEGGKYITVTGKVIKLDEYSKVLILEDKTQIPLSEIIEIDLDIN